jgi:hypothetical protein
VPGCLLNSSIADLLKPYAFSVIATLLISLRGAPATAQKTCASPHINSRWQVGRRYRSGIRLRCGSEQEARGITPWRPPAFWGSVATTNVSFSVQKIDKPFERCLKASESAAPPNQPMRRRIAYPHDRNWPHSRHEYSPARRTNLMHSPAEKIRRKTPSVAAYEDMSPCCTQSRSIRVA